MRTKDLIVLTAQIGAMSGSLAGLIFTAMGLWRESSFAWNATALILWIHMYILVPASRRDA